MAEVRALDKAWFAKVRWEILDMLRGADDAGESREDLRKRVSRLAAAGKIPETTAQLMHLILSARNKAEYESKVYSGTDARQLLSAWQSVKEWAGPPRATVTARSGVVVPDVRSQKAQSASNGLFPCPILGCRKTFQSTRGGWDAHVASYRMHPGWYPDVIDAEARKSHFRNDFPDWFES